MCSTCGCSSNENGITLTKMGENHHTHHHSDGCHVLKKVYTFYINTKIRLQFKYNPKIDLQSPFFCNNFSIYNLPF
jgi:hypothetical protein